MLTPEYITLPDGFVIDKFDVVEPMMRWMVQWSTGDNIPTGDPKTVKFFEQVTGIKQTPFLKKGLWLIATEYSESLKIEIESRHYSQLLYAWGESKFGNGSLTTMWDVVEGYTRYHAEYRILVKIRQAEEARQRKKLGH